MFAGMEYDSTTGLYYDHARYYDAVIGRFMSQDPKGFAAGDTNLYRYVGNSPTVHMDPNRAVHVYLGAYRRDIPPFHSYPSYCSGRHRLLARHTRTSK